MNFPARLDDDPAPEFADTRFTVPGIRCAGCIAKIERGLGELDGIDSARVNFSAKRVAVRHRTDVGEDDLIRGLQKLGFEAQAVAENPLTIDDKESKALLRALAVAGFGMMNIMLLSISVWSGAGGVTREMFHWLSALIALPVVAYSGRPFFASAAMALRYRRTNMDVPISIGVLLATAMSLYETATGGEHAYFDGAVMLLFFLLAGRALDATMRNRTRAGIGALLSRMGKSAAVVQLDGSTRRVSADKLEPGMVMLVAAGEALAADGVIEIGQTQIDSSMLTGESKPVQVNQGDDLHAGAVNLANPVHVRVSAVGADTTIAEIARLMDEAGQSRNRYVRIADRASRLYAPAVHSLALLAFIGWMIAGIGWHQSMLIAIAVLIITCPCALGLAVPAAQVVASGNLIKQGLLVKDGGALERLAEVDIALLDKTGTLTLGEPIPDISQLDHTARMVALALAQASRHPLSRGLVTKLGAEGVAPVTLDDITEESGSGVKAKLDGIPVALGKSGDTQRQGLSSELAIGDKRWTIEYSDILRPDAAECIAQFYKLGIQSHIVSGDNRGAVDQVARKLGIGADFEQKPQQKLAKIAAIKAQGKKPLMIGDGLNDGPALAAAHASMAPGSASDASQQAADAVFIGDRLMPAVQGVRMARRCMRIVRQNFAFAIIYNVFAVPLALAGMVTPLIAAIAMSVSSLVVVGNSIRLAQAPK